MTRFASLSLRVVLAMGLGGCSISRDALDRLNGEVAERNADRHRTAGAELAAEGYVDAPDGVQSATLADADRERCVSRELGSAPMQIQLDGDPALHLTAAPEAACPFFRGSALQLVAQSDDAATLTLHSVSGVSVMRAPSSTDLVLVRAALRTIETHRPLVDMDCDHMPQVPPDPIQYGNATVPVLLAAVRPREVIREIDHEVVDERCTRNTY